MNHSHTSARLEMLHQSPLFCFRTDCLLVVLQPFASCWIYICASRKLALVLNSELNTTGTLDEAENLKPFAPDFSRNKSRDQNKRLRDSRVWKSNLASRKHCRNICR